jgi:hypothetical protein
MDERLEYLQPPELVHAEAPHWQREHFIPLGAQELIEILAEMACWSEPDRGCFLWFCQLLRGLVQNDFLQRKDELALVYEPFDPDSLLITRSQPYGSARDQLADRFFTLCDETLLRGNFQRLSHDEILAVMNKASEWGVRLKVDFGIFRQLQVYARGDVVAKRQLRNWRTRFRVVELEVPVYQRLVILFRLRPEQRIANAEEDHAIYLRLFKNVPKQDVDMLLPGSRFRMSLFDHGKAVLPTVSGLAVLVNKILKGALMLSLATPADQLAATGFVGASMGYGMKSVLGYMRTKAKYQLNLTRSLYYQILDSNAGVLLHLIAEGEAQDFREATLAYCLLHLHGGDRGLDAKELDHLAERFLRELLGFEINFEVEDGLAKLARYGCARCDSANRWYALPPEKAVHELQQRFRELYPMRVAPQAGGSDEF